MTPVLQAVPKFLLREVGFGKRLPSRDSKIVSALFCCRRPCRPRIIRNGREVRLGTLEHILHSPRIS